MAKSGIIKPQSARSKLIMKNKKLRAQGLLPDWRTGKKKLPQAVELPLDAIPVVPRGKAKPKAITGLKCIFPLCNGTQLKIIAKLIVAVAKEMEPKQ